MSRRRKGRQATRRWSLKRVSFLKRLAGGGRAGERARLRGLRRKRTTIFPSPHSSLSLSLSLLDETRTRLVLSWSCEGALTVPANSGCCRSLQFASFSRRQVFSSIPTAPLSLSLSLRPPSLSFCISASSAATSSCTVVLSTGVSLKLFVASS